MVNDFVYKWFYINGKFSADMKYVEIRETSRLTIGDPHGCNVGFYNGGI